ncbi:hypothetical protein ACILDT_02525 [Capnocytophaga canis]
MALREINEKVKEGLIIGRPKGVGNRLTLARLEKDLLWQIDKDENSENGSN